MSLSNTPSAEMDRNSEEEALAESNKVPPSLLQKRFLNNSHSGSFDDPPSELEQHEYGQLPPGRIHGIHKKGGHHRLHGSSGSGGFLEGLLPPVPGTSTPRSRSRSPSIGRTGGAVAATTTTVPTLATTDGNSSLSSMDDYESDLLTDRAGVLDDLSESQRRLHHSGKEFHVPATVLERMCEDSLEDNHAFSDVVRSSSRGDVSSNASRVSHVSGSNAGDGMLEPLDECDEGLENDSLEDSVTDQNYYLTPVDAADDHPLHSGGGSGHDPLPPTTTVILTNMENLTLESANNDVSIGGVGGYSSQAGSVSLFESVGGVAGNASHAADTVGSVSLPPPVDGATTKEPLP